MTEKIISEKVNTPFEEVTEDDEEEEDEEETLEEELIPESAEDESFANFTTETVTPTLETTPIPDTEAEEPLEQELENVPSTTTGEGGGEYVLNMPYEADYEQLNPEVEREQREKNPERLPIIMTQEQASEIQDTRPINLNQWQRGMEQQKTRGQEQDYLIRGTQDRQKDDLPFQTKERKRKLNI